MWYLVKVVSVLFVLLASYLHYFTWTFLSTFESDPRNSYDFIIVGGGSAGAVIASRLSENSNYSVLLIEAGGHPPFFFNVPLSSGILSLTDYAWKYQTVSNEKYVDSEIPPKTYQQSSYWPRGKGLGGSSLINFMLYVRGSKYDFNQWEALGNHGWSYETILPLFLKSETNVGNSIEEKYHGKYGPLKVEDRVWQSKLPQAFVDAGIELGYQNLDINGENQIGFTIPQLTTDNGARCSSYSAFLKNAVERPNLKIVTFAQVQKILIDDNKIAYGIRYQRHGRFINVNASREIVLSAGAVASPHILMLSGVGKKEHLEKFDIPVYSDLNVGGNLQDHIYVPLSPLVHNDSSASLVSPTNVGALWDYLIFGKGQYTSNGVDGMAFKASKYSDKPDWPDLQLLFLSYSPASDHGVCIRKILQLEEKVWEKLFKPVCSVDTASIFATLVRPKSRGWIRLRSSDPSDDPLIDPGYYSNSQDAKLMLEALKFARQVLETKAMKKFLYLRRSSHPFCESFAFLSDSYLECLVNHMSMTLYHPSGTCKMGPSTDINAVVDPQLRVYGIKQLRVADASIMPIIPNGNINAAVVMIGEKAANIISEQYSSESRSNVTKSTDEDVPHRSRNNPEL